MAIDWLHSFRLGSYSQARPSRQSRLRCRHRSSLAAELLEDRSLLSAGDLDPSFGIDGKVLTDISAPGAYNNGRDIVAYQSDGKAIVAGLSSPPGMVAVRYNIDGSLDATFGENGIVRVDIGSYSNSVSVAVDSAGRVLLAGQSDQSGTGANFAVARLTPSGALDTSFNGDGWQTVDFGGTTDVAESVAVDSEGRVLLGGYSYKDGAGSDIAVARLTTAGALDASFDGDGKQTIDFGGADDIAYGLAVDGAGRVVVAGYSNQGATRDEFAVARLTTAGELDASFHGDGKQTVDFGGQHGDYAESVAVDSADRVVIGGYSDQGATHADFAVARLTPSGALDAGFDGDGKQTVDFGGTYDFGRSVAVDSANRVLIAGESDQVTTTGYDFGVARLTSSGELDATFSGDGKQTIDFGSSEDYAASVAVDSAGRVLLGGTSNQPATHLDFAAARLASDGTLDSTFAGDGRVTTDVGTPGNDFGRQVVAYQSDGKAIMVGASGGKMIAVRYNADGALDSTFGANGIARIDFNVNAAAYSVAIDSAGRVVIAGFAQQSATGSDFAVARLTPSGLLDTSFSGDGKQTIDFGGTVDLGASVAVDSADRVLIAGYSQQRATGYDFAVARLTSSGELDTSFSGDGKQTADFGGTADRASGIAVDSADRVIVVGYTFQSVSSNDFAVVRLTSSGELDASFSGDGKQTVNFFGSDIGFGVAIDGADRVLVDGYSNQGATRDDFAVARLTSSGELDTSFSGDGKQTVDFGGTFDEATSVTVDNAGRVLMAGYTQQTATGFDFAVARLTPLGELDANFAGDGTETIDFGGGTDRAYSVAVDSAGRLLVGGQSDQNIVTYSDFALARLLTNSPPKANAGGPYVVDEGTPLTLDASASSDPDQTTASLTFQWDLNYDGATFDVDATGASPTMTFADDVATRTIALRVIDADGASDIATTTLTVNNVAPLIASFDNVTFGSRMVSPDVGGVPGQTLAFSGAFTDAGTLDTHTATVDWDDGSAAAALPLTDGAGSGTISGSHVYAAAGVYHVQVTVTDDDGGGDTKSFDVTVADAALLPDTRQAGETALYVGGTTGADNITITPAATAGQVDVTIDGDSLGAFAPSFNGRIVVFAQAGDDDVQVSGGISNSAWLYGGDGDDRLKGGGGNDVLLGENGEDLLVGGSGRDLLVGGRGSDRIVGNADDDIVISGWLAFANRDQAIYDIMNEWTSADDYQTRTAKLSNALVLGGTVLDDADDYDVLTGSAGDDWFFFDPTNDKATDLKDEAFANDLDWIQSAV